MLGNGTTRYYVMRQARNIYLPAKNEATERAHLAPVRLLRWVIFQ